MVPAMAWLSLSMLAFGLAMDATAVAAARGIASPVVRPRHALICAAWFGGFQALMPLVGALLGAAVGAVDRGLGPLDRLRPLDAARAAD